MVNMDLPLSARCSKIGCLHFVKVFIIVLVGTLVYLLTMNLGFRPVFEASIPILVSLYECTFMIFRASHAKKNNVIKAAMKSSL